MTGKPASLSVPEAVTTGRTGDAAWWLDEQGNDTCPCHSLSTCECAVSQIKPAWDYKGRLVCEDCYGQIARASKMSGQNARPGGVSNA